MVGRNNYWSVYSVKEMRWNTFDQFKRRNFAVWIVTLPKDDDNWKNGKCTCPGFFKKYICKHIIGLSIRLKYVRPPATAKQVPIGQKRKRGRPKQATKALIID
jgi:predicted nucleic acid-binding Zn finger protein